MAWQANLDNAAVGDPAAPFRVEVQYADGRLRFDDAVQMATILYVADAVGIHFKLMQQRSDVYFAHDLPIRYGEGSGAEEVVPDFFVTLGVDVRRRGTYNLREESKPPDFALDVVTGSKDPRRAWRAKPELYAALGIRECWQFDPTGQDFEPRLRGFRLAGGQYEALPRTASGGVLTVRSEVLGLEMQCHGHELRMRDPETGEVFPTMDEATVAMVEAQARLREEDRACRAAVAGARAADAALRAERKARVEAEAALRAEEQALAEAEVALRAERRKRKEAQAGLRADLRNLEEAEAALRAERRKRKEAQAGLRADLRNLEEAEAALRAERRKREEAQARLRVERQGREEAQARLRAERKGRQEAQARIAELEARVEAALRRRARHARPQVAQTSGSTRRSQA